MRGVDVCVLVILVVARTAAAQPAPELWQCPLASFDDGVCDCGCGVVDADCVADPGASDAGIVDGGADGGVGDAGSVDAGTTTLACANDRCVDGSFDPSEPTRCIPDGWSCAVERAFDALCDCGCNAPDPSCPQPTTAEDCEHNDCFLGLLEDDDVTRCRDLSTPPGWDCASWIYGSGQACDCGCGATDADCPLPADVEDCDATWCPDGWAPDPWAPSTCYRLAPPEWQCFDIFYVDADCDCGCGALDPVCVAGTPLEACDAEYCPSGTRVDPDDLGGCVPAPIPSSWTCSPLFWGDVICDCGCGAVDPDCPVPGDERACDVDNCASGIVDEADPSQCTQVPSGWTCDAFRWNAEDRCDCECGIPDPDCLDPLPAPSSCGPDLVCRSDGTCGPPAAVPDAGGDGDGDGDDDEEPAPGCAHVTSTAGAPWSMALAVAAALAASARRRRR